MNLPAQKGTLLEFGWDYPNVAQLDSSLFLMQNTPFDGICFSLQPQIMDAFDTSLRQPGYFEQDRLSRLKWGKYKANFIILWGFATTGGSWYDDKAWKTICTNMENLSRAMARPNISGVLFDPEYYYQDQMYNPWTYNKKQYPHQSFLQVQVEVKKRGKQFITALQKHKSNLSFLSIWITSLIAIERRNLPLADTRHALLLPFIEGVLEAKQDSVKVIDGNEFAYYYSNPSQFLESKIILQKNLVELVQSGRAKAEALKVTIAQPLYYDGLAGVSPAFNRGFSTSAKWKWLEENTKFAMAATDEITWFYSERLNWWKGPVNDTLYRILVDNKIAQETSLPLKSTAVITARIQNINRGQGYYYLYDTTKPMKTGDTAFHYRLDRRSKRLSIDFHDKQPLSVSVFINNALPKTQNVVDFKLIINLDNFDNGKLVILAKYKDGSEASAIEVYK